MKLQMIKKTPFTISGIDDRFLQAMYRYHMLKPEQLTRRFYSKGSLTFVKARLKRLVDEGYLDANEQPTVRGRSPFYYTLAGKGIKYLKEMGFEINRYYRPSRRVEYLPFLLHTFSVNDVLIAAELLVEGFPQLTLAEVQYELVLKHEPCKVSLRRDRPGREGHASIQQVIIIPDGWLDFRYNRGSEGAERRMCLWLEVDRGTVGMRDFKDKAAAIWEYYKSGAYQKRFGTSSLRVAFATTEGMARVRHMQTWLRDVIARQHEKSGMDQRFLCSAMPAEIDPRMFFLAPIWYSPFDDTGVVSLLTTE